VTPTGQVTEFAVTNNRNNPTNIVAGADGKLWFVGSENSITVSAITTAGVITDYPLPTTSMTFPDDIAKGPDGNVWLTEIGSRKIAKVTPAGAVTEYPVAGFPYHIIAGPDGNLWFTLNATVETGKIGKMTTNGTVTLYDAPAAFDASDDIAKGPDGNLWFSISALNAIGKITPTGSVQTFAVPTAGAHPLGMTAGNDGNVWFTEMDTGKVGSITPGGVITEYALPNAQSQPVNLTIGPDGNLWIAEFGSNKVARMTLCSSDSSSSDSSEGAELCAPICGDGIKVAPEQCDDGNLTNGDGCSSTCKTGGGTSSSNSANSSSTSLHKTSECGNGTIDEGEACDDENTDDGDGCSASCEIENGWKCPISNPSSGGTTSEGGTTTDGGSCGDGVCNTGEGCTGLVTAPECLSTNPCVLDCPSGRVTTTSCSDSDGGDQPKFHAFVQASIPGRNALKTDDVCLIWGGTTGKQVEYQCMSQQELRWYTNTCNCDNGSCVTPSGTAPGSQACSDTDQQDMRIAGSVTAAGQRYDDECHPINPAVVLERFCTASGPNQRQLFCPFGYKCSNGACTVPDLQDTQTVCTDSDGGLNLATKGTLQDSTSNARRKDDCASPTSVNENYCVNGHYGFLGNGAPEGGGYDTVELRCPSGTTCQDGACQ
jgi:cysteine-rich repeat protein